MLNCAYCDMPCQQTREHVVPRWYNDTLGEAENFSARAPLTHVKGDLIVRDVCTACNSGVLSSLDGYGKELYGHSFALPVYAEEAVTFDYRAGDQSGDRYIDDLRQKVEKADAVAGGAVAAYLTWLKGRWSDATNRECYPAVPFRSSALVVRRIVSATRLRPFRLCGLC